MSPDPAAASAADAAAVFAALGDSTRLALCLALAEAPCSVTALARGRPMSRQAVTKHLQALAGAGLAQPIRAGRQTIWHARLQGLDPAREVLDRIGARWDAALDRLKAHVEDAATPR